MTDRGTLILELLWLVVFIIICQLAGALGAVFTAKAIPTWYSTLIQPEVTPPNWVFAPVWISLYAIMGISVWLVWRQRGSAGVTVALVLFFLQLAVNALWTPLFFGAHALLAALVDIVILLVLIVVYIVVAYPISRFAAVLMVPYALWVAFATYLNYRFWALN
jgi:tryptophan-rich sensory protein